MKVTQSRISEPVNAPERLKTLYHFLLHSVCRGTHKYAQLIFDKCANQIQWRKANILVIGHLPREKKREHRSKHHCFEEVNYKMNYELKCKTKLQHFGKNQDKGFRILDYQNY